MYYSSALRLELTAVLGIVAAMISSGCATGYHESVNTPANVDLQAASASVDPNSWVVANPKGPKFIIYVHPADREHPENAKEEIVQFGFEKNGSSPSEQIAKLIQLDNCQSAQPSPIKSTDSEAISDVQIKNCPGHNDVYRIYRLIWGQKFATFFIYNYEGQPTAAQRDAALRTLSGFTFGQKA